MSSTSPQLPLGQTRRLTAELPEYFYSSDQHGPCARGTLACSVVRAGVVVYVFFMAVGIFAALCGEAALKRGGMLLLCCRCGWHGQSKAQAPELKKFMEKRMHIKLNANRKVSGILRGFDQFMNLVLEDTVEEVSATERNDIGMVVRGVRCKSTRMHL